MAMDRSPVLFLTTPEDNPYLHNLKPMMQGRQTFIIDQTPDTFAELKLYANSKGIKYIVSTSKAVLNKVVESYKSQSIDNWQGSIFERQGITFLFLNPLKQFYSVSEGKFLAERFLSKILAPAKWERTPAFTWELARLDTVEKLYEDFSSALIIAEDIETKSFEDANGEYQTLIRCVVYTGLWANGTIHSIVLPISEAPNNEQSFWISWMRKFNLLPIPKIFQNGNYDNFHLICYGAPVSHYLWDTQSLFHSWYSELPKRLDFIAAFSVHNIFYWKDLAGEGGLMKLFEYNARDGWATLLTWMYLIKNMPDWAIRNYLLKFPLFAPCLTCNLEGVKADGNKRAELITKYIADFTATDNRLRKWFGDGFNPRSPTQVLKLIHFYGSSDISSTDESDIRKFSLRHPLNARFAGEILKSRETSKIISTYLKPTDFSVSAKSNSKRRYLLKHGRIFYSLNPDGTDTGRLACSEGSSWTGNQIQNTPEAVKEMYIPDEGFEMFELDNTTSESFCAGYLSGDKNLLETLTSGKDFHAVNASRFFGIPYEQIVEMVDGIKKVLNKEIRNLSKRTNHGATYNMGAMVLLTTMGEENVDKAKKLLNLPSKWNRIEVCEYLLQCFDTAYPTVRSDWYSYLKVVVTTTRMLTSPLGWTRYFFGNPGRNKHDLNALVAHGPQNLSVGIINDGLKDIFWKVQVPNYRDFRLKAQIHDSIFGQNRIGRRDLVWRARELMIRPTPVKDIHGIERIMTIPVAAKFGPNWGELKEVEAPQNPDIPELLAA